MSVPLELTNGAKHLFLAKTSTERKGNTAHLLGGNPSWGHYYVVADNWQQALALANAKSDGWLMSLEIITCPVINKNGYQVATAESMVKHLAECRDRQDEEEKQVRSGRWTASWPAGCKNGDDFLAQIEECRKYTIGLQQGLIDAGIVDEGPEDGGQVFVGGPGTTVDEIKATISAVEGGNEEFAKLLKTMRSAAPGSWGGNPLDATVAGLFVGLEEKIDALITAHNKLVDVVTPDKSLYVKLEELMAVKAVPTPAPPKPPEVATPSPMLTEDDVARFVEANKRNAAIVEQSAKREVPPTGEKPFPVVVGEVVPTKEVKEVFRVEYSGSGWEYAREIIAVSLNDATRQAIKESPPGWYSRRVTWLRDLP